MLAALVGCAPYVAPAAGEGFLTTPFRSQIPELEPPAPPVRRASRRPPALALARIDPPLEKMITAKLAPGEKAAAPGLAPAALVEGSLRLRGVRFGTDGDVASLYEYMRLEQALVPASAARTGDVLFFQVASEACADHAGVVEAVDSGGRITFREVRGGTVRTSYVHPAEPSLRRGSDGRIMNTFLRPRRTDDPPAARYFAGEMLCAVGRVRR
jgi:hypothetical protein